MTLGSVATADWLLPLLPLGFIFGRRRVGWFVTLLGKAMRRLPEAA